MSHAVVGQPTIRREPWSWRWFAIGSSTTIELLVVVALLWAFVGQWWVGGAVALAVMTATGWFARHAGPGRLPAYIVGTAMALLVTYGAISVAVGVYLQRYYS